MCVVWFHVVWVSACALCFVVRLYKMLCSCAVIPVLVCHSCGIFVCKGFPNSLVFCFYHTAESV